MDIDPQLRALSEDGRFVVVTSRPAVRLHPLHDEGVARLDVKRNRLNNVAARQPRDRRVTASADAKRIAFTTNANNLIDGFVDNNGINGEDVFAWYDAPPVAAVDSRVTGSLSSRSTPATPSTPTARSPSTTGPSGYGPATAQGVEVSHGYPDEGNYEVKLTIEDDGGNEVVHTFEVVAIKGILTTGARPIDFIGVDKHLRCSVVPATARCWPTAAAPAAPSSRSTARPTARRT